MNIIMNIIKSKRFGHALGMLLVGSVFIALYFLAGTIEFNSLHN